MRQQIQPSYATGLQSNSDHSDGRHHYPSLPTLFPVSLIFQTPGTRWGRGWGYGGGREEERPCERAWSDISLAKFYLQYILKFTDFLILRLDAWLLLCPQSFWCSYNWSKKKKLSFYLILANQSDTMFFTNRRTSLDLIIVFQDSSPGCSMSWVCCRKGGGGEGGAERIWNSVVAGLGYKP